MSGPWSYLAGLRDITRGPVRLALEPNDVQRKAIAKLLGLAGLDGLRAELVLAPWHDGMTVKGRLEAEVSYICGISLEAFPDKVEEEIEIRLVPADSPLAVTHETELTLDPEAEDPPDSLEPGDMVDLGALVVEHLSLALDPFPRKPGAVFEPPQSEAQISPFSALKALKREP
ncbi:MAG: hypothetical protein JWM33_2726 [Caulobacteraceae bacterium]|nr:hypothetical protein [Caulobacteraceae bacterium]